MKNLLIRIAAGVLVFVAWNALLFAAFAFAIGPLGEWTLNERAIFAFLGLFFGLIFALPAAFLSEITE